MEIDEYKNFVRSFHFMSTIERSKNRTDITQEFFTPLPLVNEILDNMEIDNPTLFSDVSKTILDNAAGDGQFLTEVVIRKMERSNCSLLEALETTFGVELMEDNVKLCKKRLAGPDPTKEILDILDKHIVCADALKYHYKFDGT